MNRYQTLDFQKLVSIPMCNAFTTAHGRLQIREGALVKLQTDNGLVGFGDIAPLAGFCSGNLSDALNALPELVTCISAMSIDEALTLLIHSPWIMAGCAFLLVLVWVLSQIYRRYLPLVPVLIIRCFTRLRPMSK